MPQELASEAIRLRNCAVWNHNRACDLWKYHFHEKNHDRQEVMLRDYVRLTRNGDACNRKAWMLERGKIH